MPKENYTVLLVAALLAAVYGTPGHRCGPPPLPKHGGIEGGARNYYELGEYAEYLCDYGYESDGPAAAVCIYGASEGAYWNNPPPDCKGMRKESHAVCKNPWANTCVTSLLTKRDINNR